VNERLPYYCAIALGFQLRRLHTVHLRRISHYRAIALGFQLRRLHNVHLVRNSNITHHRFIGILIVLGLVDKCSGLNRRGVLEIECPFFKGEKSRASPWKQIPLCRVPQCRRTSQREKACCNNHQICRNVAIQYSKFKIK
jgi:hypothetical protein